MKISQHTALITGGCSGLGLATAEALIEAGANVVLIDLNEKAGQALQQSWGPQRSLFIKADVTSDAEMTAALAKIKAVFNSLSICINCAGIAPAQRLLNKKGNAADLELFSRTISINLTGTFNVARLAAQLMAKNQVVDGERGIIINTASIAGFEGQIGQTAYAASKAGIIGLTLPMARDLSALGIRVNSIAPGIMATPLLLAMPQEVQDALSANVPNPKRLGLPEEFASLVIHMIENSYMNGETVRLDGALRMQPK